MLPTFESDVGTLHYKAKNLDNTYFNNLAIEIWERNFTPDGLTLIPLILPPLIRNKILFIGLNPSHNPEVFRRILATTEYSLVDLENFFTWTNRNDLDLSTAIGIENAVKERHPYFKKCHEIGDDANLKWDHIDLFFYRETRQNAFKERFYAGNRFTASAICQLELSKQLVNYIDPRLIIVINAFASTIFEDEFKARFDDDLGFHTIELNKRKVPVLLGSMLTGQRALDRYSFQRLKWFVRKAIAPNIGRD